MCTYRSNLFLKASSRHRITVHIGVFRKPRRKPTWLSTMIATWSFIVPNTASCGSGKLCVHMRGKSKKDPRFVCILNATSTRRTYTFHLQLPCVPTIVITEFFRCGLFFTYIFLGFYLSTICDAFVFRARLAATPLYHR